MSYYKVIPAVQFCLWNSGVLDLEYVWSHLERTKRNTTSENHVMEQTSLLTIHHVMVVKSPYLDYRRTPLIQIRPCNDSRSGMAHL